LDIELAGQLFVRRGQQFGEGGADGHADPEGSSRPLKDARRVVEMLVDEAAAWVSLYSCRPAT
jgi:hypothetical protein